MARVPHPLLLIALDGGTFDVLRPLVAAGRLPHLGELIARGLCGDALSTQPPATFPAWTSLLTACEPVQHGVTDLFVRRAGSYDLVAGGGAMRRLPTLFAEMSARGLAVASLGIPGTFPPESVNGLVVAGFDSPAASRASPRSVFPRALHAELERMGGWRYMTFNEQRRQLSPSAAQRALLADLEVKERITLALYRRRAWDLFAVHLQAADTAGHHFWHLHDPASPRARGEPTLDVLATVYERLDAFVGRLVACAPSTTRVVVVSDHGMGGASRTAVHLNRVLADAHLLSFSAGSRATTRRFAGALVRRALAAAPTPWLGAATQLIPSALAGPLLALARGRAVDFAHTLAFSDELDYAPSIWINRRGVFPSGTVDEHDAAPLAARISDLLLALCDDQGRPLVRAVHDRATHGAGPAAARLPDLTLEPAWPGGYRPSFLTSPVPGPSVRTLGCDELAAPRGAGMPGAHRREGVFIAAGPGLTRGALPALPLCQIGALLWALLGFAPPTHATPLPPFARDLAAALLGEERLDGRANAAPVLEARGYTEREQALLTERLRALGYID